MLQGSPDAPIAFLPPTSLPFQPNAPFSLVDAISSRLPGLIHRLEIHLVVCRVHQLTGPPRQYQTSLSKQQPPDRNPISGELLPSLVINCASFEFFTFVAPDRALAPETSQPSSDAFKAPLKQRLTAYLAHSALRTPSRTPRRIGHVGSKTADALADWGMCQTLHHAQGEDYHPQNQG